MLTTVDVGGAFAALTFTRQNDNVVMATKTWMRLTELVSFCYNDFTFPILSLAAAEKQGFMHCFKFKLFFVT